MQAAGVNGHGHGCRATVAGCAAPWRVRPRSLPCHAAAAEAPCSHSGADEGQLFDNWYQQPAVQLSRTMGPIKVVSIPGAHQAL